MEAINELELRSVLRKRKEPSQLIASIIKRILDPSLPWEEKRAFWHFLLLSGRDATLIEGLIECLRSKARIPFDALIAVCEKNGIKPTSLAIEGVLKGLKRQSATEELILMEAWDEFDGRFAQIRRELIESKSRTQEQFKQDLMDKFEFLRSQRMIPQAQRILRRLMDLYPEDRTLRNLKSSFDEDWAREVLASHRATLSSEKFETTLTAPSRSDQEMVKCFLAYAEQALVDNRGMATEMAITLLFLGEHRHALDILAWAQPSPAVDWLRAELLVKARHFVEALEHLNQLEVKFSEDPESTFAVSYLRAQCLMELGQSASALEIMQSIVRVRPNYRSAHALILDWVEGASWE